LAEERARRRCREIADRGRPADLVAVQRDIEARDACDSSRDDSPMRPADDAWQLDTSGLSIGQAVSAVLQKARQRAGRQ